MSDTPRTDAFSHECLDGDLNGVMVVSVLLAQQLERELAETLEWKERYERLNKSLAQNKRLFSSALAERVIDEQAQRIRQLESLYSEMQKQYHELKSKCTQ